MLLYARTQTHAHRKFNEEGPPNNKESLIIGSRAHAVKRRSFPLYIKGF